MNGSHCVVVLTTKFRGPNHDHVTGVVSSHAQPAKNNLECSVVLTQFSQILVLALYTERSCSLMQAIIRINGPHWHIPYVANIHEA